MDKSQKTVGVLGGMGPAATVDFLSAVISLSDADKDQDHLHMIVDHNPHVPDRQAALAGDRRPVEEALVAMATRLEAAGADFLVMPCNTAHVFVAPALQAVSIPLIHIIEESVRAIDADAGSVGVMATTACLEAGIYQAAISESGRTPLLPGPGAQKELMNLIFRIKAGEKGDGLRTDMANVAQSLIDEGAAAIIAGCTEIPIVLDQEHVGVPLISSSAVLAKRTIEFATDR